MLNGTVMVDVRNLTDHKVSYEIPELNIKRSFNIGETKKLQVKEVKALFNIDGGEILVKDFLSVQNEELLDELFYKPEAEYYWTKQDIEDVLLRGTVARLQDALEFAPEGIVEYIKSMAVSLQINDMAKRQAIQDATGFNINNAISLANLPDDDAVEETLVSSVGQRRVPVDVTN